MGLLKRVKGIGHDVAKTARKAVGKAQSVGAAPVKYVGGTAAKFLGSDKTFSDFDRGLKTLLPGGKKPQWNKAATATGTFVAGAIPAAVDHTGDLVRDTAKELTTDAGGLITDAVTGLFDGGGIVLVLVLAAAAYLVFATPVGKRVLG